MKQKILIFLATIYSILIKNPSLPALPQISNSHFSAGTPITLIATGDVMLGRSINARSVQQKNFTWMWEKTSETLRAADLTLINLESPFVQDCPTTNTGMIFCADVRNLEGLILTGVDIANLANNHINNFGQEGIKTTIELLNNAGIAPIGNGVPVFREIKNTRFVFLGFNALNRLPDIAQEISTAKAKTDIIVVCFHWGVEYTDQPTARQQELAHLAIDSGADLVVGHHPHWIQPTETYKDKLIVYSLGNFIFDQSWSLKTRQGLLGKFTFLDKKLINSEFLPIEISTSGQPSLK